MCDCVDIIDPAILRPGRMDKLLYVGLPNSTDRFEILHKITKVRYLIATIGKQSFAVVIVAGFLYCINAMGIVIISTSHCDGCCHSM